MGRMQHIKLNQKEEIRKQSGKTIFVLYLYFRFVFCALSSGQIVGETLPGHIYMSIVVGRMFAWER